MGFADGSVWRSLTLSRLHVDRPHLNLIQRLKGGLISLHNLDQEATACLEKFAKDYLDTVIHYFYSKLPQG